MNKKNLLFLSCGKGYASKLAEVLFNAHAEENNLGWQAISKRRDFPNNSGGYIKAPLARKLDGHLLSSLNLNKTKELCVPELVNPADLQFSDLLIVIAHINEFLDHSCDRSLGYAEEADYWVIRDAKDFPKILNNSMAKLVSELSKKNQ